MENFALVIMAVAGLVVGSAVVQASDFQEVTPTGAEYLWSTADNWDTAVPPDSATNVDIGYDTDLSTLLAENAVVAGVVDGSKADVFGGSTLTIKAGGTLNLEGSAFGVLNLGVASGDGTGTLQMDGGELNFVNNASNHGTCMFIGRADGGLVEQTGGTSTMQAPFSTSDLLEKYAAGFAISAMSATQKNTYNMSGGTLIAHYALLPHPSATAGGVWNLSGDATVIINGDGYNSGLQLTSGGTLTVTGSNVSFNVTQGIEYGGWNNDPGSATIAMEADSGGFSILNGKFLELREFGKDTPNLQVNILDLSHDGSLALGTYAVFHTEDNPDANLPFLQLTGDSGFVNLRTIDIAGDGTLGYNVVVDYIPEPMTMVLLAVGGAGALLRQRRRLVV